MTLHYILILFASTYQVLGLQEYTTTASLCGAEHRNRAFDVLGKLSLTPAWLYLHVYVPSNSNRTVSGGDSLFLRGAGFLLCLGSFF